TFELPAEKAGILRIVAQEGDTLEIGALVATIEEGGAPAAAEPKKAQAEAPAENAQKVEEKPVAQADSSGSYAAGTASPAAAKILREKGLDAASIQGTGKDGRITKEDAEKAEAPKAKAAEPAKTAPAAAAEAPKQVPGSRDERREKLSSLRKTIAKRLVSVKNETAMLTTFNEVNMKPIMDLRAKYKEQFKEKHGVGLGFMSFFTKAV